MSDTASGSSEGPDSRVMKNPLFGLFSNTRYPHPYSMFHDKPGEESGHRADANGFLNLAAPAMPKPEGEKRIFLSGNSAVRVGGFDNSIPACLEKIFRANGRDDVRVYNMGIGSGISSQFLMYLMQEGVDLKPDLVITYDGYVDLFIPLTYDPRPGYTYNHYILELIHEHLGEGRLQELDIVRAESERRAILRNRVSWKSPEWEDRIVGAYLSSIRKIHEIAGLYGFRAYSCLQPILAGKKSKVGNELKIKPAATGYKYVLKIYDKARAARQQMEVNLPPSTSRFGDLARLFEDDPTERFVDMSHVNLEAHMTIAERLFREIDGLV
jgi:hypothetical protein